MGRTGGTALRKHVHLRHDRQSRARPKAEMRMLSPNRISSSAYSPRRRAVPRPRLGDGRMSNRDRDRRHHSHTRGLSRRSLPRSYRDEDTYHENEECIMELTDSGAESNDSDFFWDEERTLFSDLMGEIDLKDDDSEDWTDHLLDSLQVAFHGESVELKKDIAQTFVPTGNLIKKCYRTFEEQDEEYGKGVLMLNTVLKEYEIMSVATEDKLKEVHGLVQNKIEMLLEQLGEVYSQRDKLWIAMVEEMNKYVDPVADLLRKTPTNVERAIAGLDKARARAVEKDEGNSTMYSEQMLKSLLAGF